MILREATPNDQTHIRDIHLSAFEGAENETVARLATELLATTSTPRTLSLIAERDGRAIGHVAFSPVRSVSDDQPIGYILAPLAIHPDYQRNGVGNALVNEGLNRIRTLQLPYTFVYGDPAYYSRFGFSTETTQNIRPLHQLKYPHGWQGIQNQTATSPQKTDTIRCVDALEKPELW